MTEAQLLDFDAFNRLVLEEGLKTWEVNGYIYAGMKGKDGWELYRTYGTKWMYLYQARRVATQANVAGGAVVVDVTIATGKMARLVGLYTANSGTNTLGCNIVDEDNALAVKVGLVGSAAGNSLNYPSSGGAATSSANIIHSTGMIVGPGQKLSVFQGAAGAQNDTLTIGISLLLPISATLSDISWSIARSTNPGDVTLAASTVSTANSWQAVLLPCP